MSDTIAQTQMLGTLEAIWRYPVKSLRREPMVEVRLETHGIAGDRGRALYVVRGNSRVGKAYRGKEHHLFHTVASESEARDLAATQGYEVEPLDASGGHDFDASPVSLVLSNWLDDVSSALGRPLDVQRWRPNLFVRAPEALRISESDLVGKRLDLGECTMRVRSTIERCVTTTYDVDTGEPDPSVLRHVARERDNIFGIYCEVEVEGIVRSGDALRLRDR